jgi:hypothetical protein
MIDDLSIGLIIGSWGHRINIASMIQELFNVPLAQ